MVEKIKFKNRSGKKIEILIEPSAEYIDVIHNDIVIFEFVRICDEAEDTMLVVLEDDMLIVYESGHTDLKIFVNNELKYSTSPRGV